MPTPSKPVNVIRMEGKSHRTKHELRERERAEEQLLTGKILRETDEVKANPIAHKEFQRIKKLLKSIEKDDDLYGSVINRYCILQAECQDFAEKREKMYQNLLSLEEKYEHYESNDMVHVYYKTVAEMQKSLLNLDKQVQTKRKMLMDIEKENVMTIAASLRSIPKKTEKKKNPLLEALSGGS